MTKPPLVEVTWRDACLHSRTFTDDTLTTATLAVRITSGYLVRADDAPGNHYVAQTLDPTDEGAWEYDGIFTIPSAWVVTVKHKTRRRDGARRTTEPPREPRGATQRG